MLIQMIRNGKHADVHPDSVAEFERYGWAPVVAGAAVEPVKEAPVADVPLAMVQPQAMPSVAIDRLNLHRRTVNALRQAGITTVDQLIAAADSPVGMVKLCDLWGINEDNLAHIVATARAADTEDQG